MFKRSDIKQVEKHVEEEPQIPDRWASAATLAESENMGFNQPKEWNDDGPEDYDSSEWLDRKTKSVQDKSLQSSRRALQRLHAAEETSQRNLVSLANQGEQLTNAERRLEAADFHVSISDTKTAEIKANNRFFMIPTFGARKKAEKKQAALAREREEAEAALNARANEHKSRASNLRQMADSGYSGYSQSTGGGNYTTPYGLARDDSEAEIDHNLDQISSGLSRIKMMGLAMNTETDTQSQQISRIQDKTSRTDQRVVRSTGKLNGLLKK